MVRLEEHKQETEHKPIQAAPLPQKVYIPLSQHIGKICSPLVKPGDLVSIGQKIGAVDSHVSAPVHSSVSGKVVSIEDWPHPVLGKCKAVIIESDGNDSSQFTARISQREIDKLSPEQIRGIIFEAGVVGMGGASFPAHIKLTPPKPVDSLIINGAECEPYLNSDNRLMIEKTEQIIAGIGIIVKCSGVKNIYIAIENNKPEAINAFKALLRNSGYILKVLKSFYPQGGERQLIRNILRREVPSGKLPFDIGAIVHNVATVYAIYEALYLGKPLYERAVTVTGDCLENPGNLLVRIGTPVKDLIAKCGPLRNEPKRIIFGGPMMGIAQFSLDVPVVKNTNGIICLAEDETKSLEEELCIRCGRCVESCPMGLLPCMLSLAGEKEKWDLAKAYGCLDCMECGACNYVCPQRKNIVQAIRSIKSKVRK